MRLNKRTLGSEEETVAVDYLKREGFTILERNFRSRTGEIDIVCKEGPYLVFTEVKFRKNAAFGDPAEAVGPMKQKKIFDTARFYLLKRGIAADCPVRFDVVAILGTEVKLYRNAFVPF